LERKLTAILCADVHGYSRLMGEDEEATIRNLSAHRRVIDRLIEQHHGRFVNSAGDRVPGRFVEFYTLKKSGVLQRIPAKTLRLSGYFRKPGCPARHVKTLSFAGHPPVH
jgi:hypothetical protein